MQVIDRTKAVTQHLIENYYNYFLQSVNWINDTDKHAIHATNNTYIRTYL